MLLEDEDVQAHSRILAVNYLGVYHTVKACLPDMLARRSGHVLFVGSLMAMYGVHLSVDTMMSGMQWLTCTPHRSICWLLILRRQGCSAWAGRLAAPRGALLTGCAIELHAAALIMRLVLQLLGTGVGVSISLPGMVDTPLAHQGHDNPQAVSQGLCSWPVAATWQA